MVLRLMQRRFLDLEKHSLLLLVACLWQHMALSQCLGSVAVLVATTSAARVIRHKMQGRQADSNIVLFKKGTIDSEIREFCNGQCSLMGHPDAGGVGRA